MKSLIETHHYQLVRPSLHVHVWRDEEEVVLKIHSQKRAVSVNGEVPAISLEQNEEVRHDDPPPPRTS